MIEASYLQPAWQEPSAEHPFVISSSSLSTFVECRKRYEIQYEWMLENKETPSYMADGSSFHLMMATYNNLQRGKATLADIKAFEPDPMFPVFSAYLKARAIPRQHLVGEVLLVEEPIYVQVFPHVYLRVTLDLVERLKDGTINGVDFKGLALGTAIPTPDGWTTIGAISKGDVVFGRDGKPCNVTAKSEMHFKPCFKITFSDKSEIVCDHEHRWVVSYGKYQQYQVKDAVITADELYQLLSSGKYGAKIETAMSLKLPALSLPISPYTLGAWIGDGTAHTGALTSADPEIFDNIEAEGEFLTSPSRAEKKSLASVRTIYGLQPKLRELNLIDNKHIPAMYLRSSFEQRLSLLQGLMDTDGTWSKIRKQAIFVQVNKDIVEQVRELVMSLGVTCAVIRVEGMGFGKNVTYYRAIFTPRGFNPFRLLRKASLVPVGHLKRSQRNRKDRIPTYSTRRLVTKIEPVTSVPTQCITVDSPDSTYLCGREFIPTHNSFSKAETWSTELDFQARLYSAVLEIAYPGQLCQFEHRKVRRIPPGIPKTEAQQAKADKGNKFESWTEEECYEEILTIYSKRELRIVWAEMQDKVRDLLRAREEKRFYRIPAGWRTGPGSCSNCSSRQLCVAELNDTLDDDLIEQTSRKRDALVVNPKQLLSIPPAVL